MPSFTPEEEIKSLKILMRWVAHEANNQLAIIQGAAELLSETTVENHELIAAHSNMIEAAGVRLAQMTKSMATIARSQPEIPEEKIKLSDLIASGLSLMQNKIQKSGLTLEVCQEEPPESIVLCRPGEILHWLFAIVATSLDEIANAKVNCKKIVLRTRPTKSAVELILEIGTLHPCAISLKKIS